jgi:hypothetical protein
LLAVVIFLIFLIFLPVLIFLVSDFLAAIQSVEKKSVGSTK